MFWRQMRALAPLLASVALVMLLSGCGRTVNGGASTATLPPGGLPDSVQITLGGPGIPQEKPPQLTLRALALVQQFYKTTLTLPPMPQNMPCTADAGPTYQLVFRSGVHTVAQADANRGGCGTVALSGEQQDRLASHTFWTQLDQAIVAATPVPKPQALAIQHTLSGNQPVLTAHITNVAIAQRLYSAILALPLVTQSNCSDAQYPTYQMVFQTATQAIAASISQQCQTILLDGAHQSPTGLYSLTASFQQVFTQTLAGATFAPAQPDHLVTQIQMGNATISQGQVSDLSLARQLYSTIFTLKPAAIGPDCPSQTDKINGTSTIYTLSFSQWGLPIMELSVYKGSCQLLNPTPGSVDGQTLQGDTTFWNQLNQVTK